MDNDVSTLVLLFYFKKLIVIHIYDFKISLFC